MAEQENRPPVGGKDAGYLFEFREDGVYLTVFPEAAGGVLFELSDIRQILQEHGVVDYDIVNLARMVREASGVAQKLAENAVVAEEQAAEAKSGAEEAAGEEEEPEEEE